MVSALTAPAPVRQGFLILVSIAFLSVKWGHALHSTGSCLEHTVVLAVWQPLWDHEDTGHMSGTAERQPGEAQVPDHFLERIHELTGHLVTSCHARKTHTAYWLNCFSPVLTQRHTDPLTWLLLFSSPLQLRDSCPPPGLKLASLNNEM